MQPFIAQIIYRIVCQDVYTEQYEEQWRMIFANNERHALAEAREHALKEEATFVDRHGRTVQWQLVAIKDIKPFEIENGGLLFSVIKEVEPVAAPLWYSEPQEH